MNFLSDADLERIDEASLSLLQDPGIRVEHDEIYKKLLGAGCKAGTNSNVVRFPPELVKEYLRLAPAAVRLANLRGEVEEIGPGGKSLFCTGAALSYYDLDGAYRRISSEDLASFARLIEQLENVSVIVGTSIDDAPPPARDFVGLRIMAENCGKHLRALCFSPTGASALKEMADVLAGGRDFRSHPVLSIGFTAHGPLRWTNLALDIFLNTAGKGIPTTVNGEPMAGASAPVTLAGTLAVGNAEVLSGIVINQILEPRRPCIHNLGFAHVMDMRTGIAVTGGAENCILAVAGAQIARFYNLPSASWISTDSLVPDGQAAAEKMLAAVTHLSAGVNMVWGIGQLESEVSLSPAQAVIDNEIAGVAAHYVRGFEVNDETLALDLVRAVGAGGSFLSSDHTLEHFREVIYAPSILCRLRREHWQAQGMNDLLAVAREKAQQILARPPHPALSEDQKQELLKIEKAYLAKIQG